MRAQVIGGRRDRALAVLSWFDRDAPVDVVVVGGRSWSLVVVTNPNTIRLGVNQVELAGHLKIDKEGCSIGVKGLRGLQKAADTVLKPGETALVIGRLRLRRTLPQDCPGATITAPIRVTATFGGGA